MDDRRGSLEAVGRQGLQRTSQWGSKAEAVGTLLREDAKDEAVGTLLTIVDDKVEAVGAAVGDCK